MQKILNDFKQFTMNKLKYINQKYVDYIVFIFPLSLLTGPFFIDLLIVTGGILALTYILVKNLIKNINLKNFYLFFFINYNFLVN